MGTRLPVRPELYSLLTYQSFFIHISWQIKTTSTSPIRGHHIEAGRDKAFSKRRFAALWIDMTYLQKSVVHIVQIPDRKYCLRKMDDGYMSSL